MESYRAQKLLVMNNSISWDGIRDCSKISHHDSKDYDGVDVIDYTEALKDIFKKSLPLILSMIMKKSIDIINYIFIGRLTNSDYISGVGLGMVISTIL